MGGHGGDRYQDQGGAHQGGNQGAAHAVVLVGHMASVTKQPVGVKSWLLGNEDPHAATIAPRPVGAEAGSNAGGIAAEFAGKGIAALEMVVAPPGDAGAA